MNSQEPSTSLTSSYVARPRRGMPLSGMALTLLLGCMLVMGLWISEKPREGVRPDLNSTGPVIRHHDARLSVKQTGLVKAPLVKEASALIKSMKHPGLFYTLCDAKNPPYLFAIDETGKLHATLQLAGVTNVDWEALASDEQGNLYIGDVGNNQLRLKQRTIYRVTEPDKFTSGKPHVPQTVPVTGTWHYTFSGKPFDAESLLVADDHFWIISKARVLGNTRLYSLPMAGEGKSAVIHEVGKLPKELLMVTDASLSLDRTEVALLSNFHAAIFPLVNGQIKDMTTAEPTYYEFDLYKAEGCCWDGNDLRMISEDRKIYKLPIHSSQKR